VREELAVAEEELRVTAEELSRASARASLERDRYKLLFERAPAALLMTDALGMIRDANEAAAALFGVPLRFVRQKPIAVFVESNDVVTLRRALASGISIEPVELRLRLRSRQRGALEATLRGAAIDHGRQVFWVISELPEDDESAAPTTEADLRRKLRD